MAITLISFPWFGLQPFWDETLISYLIMLFLFYLMPSESCSILIMDFMVSLNYIAVIWFVTVQQCGYYGFVTRNSLVLWFYHLWWQCNSQWYQIFPIWMSWENIFFFCSNLLIMGLLGVICASLIIIITSLLIYLSANIYLVIYYCIISNYITGRLLIVLDKTVILH